MPLAFLGIHSSPHDLLQTTSKHPVIDRYPFQNRFPVKLSFNVFKYYTIRWIGGVESFDVAGRYHSQRVKLASTLGIP